jgi:hypothetical protein
MAYTCNSNYSGGRDQENQGSKPAQADDSRDPISKKPNTKKGCGVAQGVGHEFKPPNPKTNKLMLNVLITIK